MASSIRISGSDEDKTRFFRLSLVIIEELTQILRDLLSNEVSHTQIHNKVKQSNYFQNLRTEQVTVISNAKTHGYQDFDITLLYTLLRNVCQNISPPSRNWGVSTMPSPLNEITVGDDIERIRLIRNQVYGHISEVAIPETEFKEYWSTISGICTRMQTLLNKDYSKRLQEAKECTIDTATENKYLELIKRLADEEKTIRDIFEELTSKEIIKIQARVAENVTIVETLIHISISILNAMVAEVEEMTPESDLDYIYESIENFIQENKEEPENLHLQNLFKKLWEKIEVYAKLKTNKFKIFANFSKFIVRMRKDYGAGVLCSKSSILLLVTFSSKSGYVFYKKDLESGVIGKQLIELFLFPPFLGSFDLKEDDIDIKLNGRSLTQLKDLDDWKMSANEENDDQKDQCHLSPVDQIRLECKSHKEICTLFCRVCDEPTCVMCVVHGHKRHYFYDIYDTIKIFKENIIGDINKREKTLDSLHLDLDENELRVFDSALSAIQDHEDMICNAVRKISCQLKVEVEKQKKHFERKTKRTHSVKEKIEKELREGIEKDKSILESNDATKILNYQPRDEIYKDWPMDTEAPYVKFLPGQVGQRELQHMFGKIQYHNTAPAKALFNETFHRNTSGKLPITDHR